MVLTREQRVALKRVYDRGILFETPNGPLIARWSFNPIISYRAFRRLVEPGPGCIMVPWCGMWLGIEPDGYTHS